MNIISKLLNYIKEQYFNKIGFEKVEAIEAKMEKMRFKNINIRYGHWEMFAVL